MKNLKMVSLVLGLVVSVATSSSAFALSNVAESEVRANLCSQEKWAERRESIMNACWNSVGNIQPRPGEVVVFGFLTEGSEVCYLPCDYQFFYLNSGN